MSPARTMTGDTVLEKGPQSPASPTNTDATLGGDAIIDVREDDPASTARSSEDSRSSVNDTPAQPRTSPPPERSTGPQWLLRRLQKVVDESIGASVLHGHDE
jgi:hypothetical protein